MSTFEEWKEYVTEYSKTVNNEHYIFDIFCDHKNFMTSPVQMVEGKPLVAQTGIFESLDDVKEFLTDRIYVYMCIQRWVEIDNKLQTKYVLRFAGVETSEVSTKLTTFGEALEDLMRGCKVARSGWNGTGMFLFLVQGSTFEVNRAPLNEFYPEGTKVSYNPHIDMKAKDGTIFPWTPNQLDMLAEDWYIVE